VAPTFSDLVKDVQLSSNIYGSMTSPYGSAERLRKIDALNTTAATSQDTSREPANFIGVSQGYITTGSRLLEHEALCREGSPAFDSLNMQHKEWDCADAQGGPEVFDEFLAAAEDETAQGPHEHVHGPDTGGPALLDNSPCRVQRVSEVAAANASDAPLSRAEARQPVLMVNPDGSQVYVLLTNEAALREQSRRKREAEEAARKAAAKATTYWVRGT
jgi:hypothetical protein